METSACTHHRQSRCPFQGHHPRDDLSWRNGALSSRPGSGQSARSCPALTGGNLPGGRGDWPRLMSRGYALLHITKSLHKPLLMTRNNGFAAPFQADELSKAIVPARPHIPSPEFDRAPIPPPLLVLSPLSAKSRCPPPYTAWSDQRELGCARW